MTPALIESARLAIFSHNSQQLARLLDDTPELVSQRFDEDKPEGLIHLAARLGKYESLAVLIQHGADVNMLYCGGNALHSAASEADLPDPQIAELLLDHGADPEQRDAAGYTPLMYASLWDRRPFAEALLRHGANLDLNSALRLEKWDLVRERICNDPCGIHQAYLPHKLLMDAILLDNHEMVEFLLNHGADPMAADGWCTPLRKAIASLTRDIQIVRSLLEHGADPNFHDRYVEQGHGTILAEARSLSRPQEVIDLLVKYGAK
jgi:ankyrin repeat protein